MHPSESKISGPLRMQLHRPKVDPEPLACLVMVQPLVDYCQTNRRLELRAVHLLPLATTDKEAWLAHYCAAAVGPPGPLAWSNIPRPLTRHTLFVLPWLNAL